MSSSIAEVRIESNDQNSQLCQNVLNWIYKDLTVKNLEKSIERTKKKLLAGVIITLKNQTQDKLKLHPELAEVWLSMKELDPDFENYLQKNAPYKKFVRYNFFDRITGNPNPDDVETHSFFKLITKWKSLQNSRPEYFTGLNDNLMLDDWDVATSSIVDKVGSLNYKNQDLVDKIKKLSKDLKTYSPNSAKTFEGKNRSLSDISKQVDGIQEDVMSNILNIYSENFNDYKDFCSQDELVAILNNTVNANFCPAEMIGESPTQTIKQKLNLISDVLKVKDLNTIFKPEKPIIETPIEEPEDNTNLVDKLCPIKIDYFKTKKPSTKATFNMRSSDIVDTIIIHHTGPGSNLKSSAESIHKAHVNRTTDNSQWYMVGYNYLLSFGGNGAKLDDPKIIQGRNSSYRGAHAGGDTLPLSPQTINQLYDNLQGFNCKEDLTNTQLTPNKIQTKTVCEQDPSESSSLTLPQCSAFTTSVADVNTDGSISGNMTSIGIALMGNYDTSHTQTFYGDAIYTTEKVNINQIKHVAIPKLVSLINALKGQYPNLKKIVPHSFFKNTACPGSVRQILNEVANQTGLEIFITKESEFARYKNTKYKHLQQTKYYRNGRAKYKYSYKAQYTSYLDIMKKIRTQEQIILEIKTQRFINNKPILTSDENKLKSAQRKLDQYYAQKDVINRDL